MNEVTDTVHGFQWGPVTVLRIATTPKGHRILTVSTKWETVEITVSPAGQNMKVERFLWRAGATTKEEET